MNVIAKKLTDPSEDKIQQCFYFISTKIQLQLQNIWKQDILNEIL